MLQEILALGAALLLMILGSSTMAQSATKTWIAGANPVGEGTLAYCAIIAQKPNGKFLLVSYKNEHYVMVQSDKLANIPDGQPVKVKFALASFASEKGFSRRNDSEILVEYPATKASTVAGLMGSLENRNETLTVSTGNFSESYNSQGLNEARANLLGCKKKL